MLSWTTLMMMLQWNIAIISVTTADVVGVFVVVAPSTNWTTTTPYWWRRMMMMTIIFVIMVALNSVSVLVNVVRMRRHFLATCRWFWFSIFFLLFWIQAGVVLLIPEPFKVKRLVVALVETLLVWWSMTRDAAMQCWWWVMDLARGSSPSAKCSWLLSSSSLPCPPIAAGRIALHLSSCSCEPATHLRLAFAANEMFGFRRDPLDIAC